MIRRRLPHKSTFQTGEHSLLITFCVRFCLLKTNSNAILQFIISTTMFRVAAASSMVAMSLACFPQCGDSCELMSPPGQGEVTRMKKLKQECTAGEEVTFSVDYNPCTHNLEYVVKTPKRCEQRQGNVFTCKKNKKCKVIPYLTELKHCDCSKCEKLQCEWTQRCALQEVQCVQAPCDKQPTCVDRPCDLQCAKGEECRLEQVQCVAPPCDPVPTCVAKDPVGCTEEGHVCPDGSVVFKDENNNCEFFPCPDQCKGECEFDEECVLQQVQCVQAPCPPVPVCVDKPCTRECPAGEECELRVVQCLIAPCPIEETCVPSVPVSPCDKCEALDVCYLKEVVCVSPPCNPVPTCVTNHCATVRCGSGTDCLIANNGDSAICKPWSEISCLDQPCDAGFTCQDVKRVCKQAPCSQFVCNAH